MINTIFLQAERLSTKQYIKCPKCGRTVKYVANNIVYCPQCGLVLKEGTYNAPFIPTDLRRFSLSSMDYPTNFNLSWYQADLIKMIRYLEAQGGIQYAARLRRLIDMADKVSVFKTDMNRELPKIFLSQVVEKFEEDNNVSVRYR